MIKRLLIPAFLALMLVGCTALEKQADDPNSQLTGAVNTIDSVARTVQETAPAAGPYGWVAGAVATVIAGATGVYKVRQKNQTIARDGQVITAQQREFNIVRDTTKAIVDAIEDVGMVKIANTDETIGSAVKARVADELKKKNLDTMGKAIISGIKASRNETQKT
jgi:hypothetical protein